MYLKQIISVRFFNMNNSNHSNILIIGGGLTALDALHVLHRRGHAGRITLVTPEGMLPPVQTDWQDAPSLDWPDNLRGSGFLRFMRQSVKDGDWSQTEWQRRFEGLRLERALFYSTFSTADQKIGMNAFMAKEKPAFKDE